MAFAFSIAALVPLLAAAFVGDYKVRVRLAVMTDAVTLALAAFGGV